MRKAILAAGIAACTAGSATAEGAIKLEDAVALEWTFANCEGVVPPIAIMFSQATINGSDPKVVEAAREAFRQNIAAIGKETACAKAKEAAATIKPPA